MRRMLNGGSLDPEWGLHLHSDLHPRTPSVTVTGAAQFREILVKANSSDVQDPGCLRGEKHFRNPKVK
ncbi:unnamed protein product, partial [Gulo gulo]